MASTTFAPSFSPLFSGTASRPLTKSIKPCSVFFLRRLSVKALANNDRSVDVQVSNNRGTYGSSLERRRSSPLGKSNSQSTEQKWVTIGVVTESLPNGMFWVELENKEKILGYISGRIRKNSVRVLPGDRVKIEVNRYDTSRARIVYRIGK